jgi:hypothetical protein
VRAQSHESTGAHPWGSLASPVSYDDQRARWAALRADQELIDLAASRLRHETAQDPYRGLRDPHVAFGLASILTSCLATCATSTRCSGVGWSSCAQSCSFELIRQQTAVAPLRRRRYGSSPTSNLKLAANV